MKKLTLTSLLILPFFTAPAQNWQCLQNGVVNYFINSNGYLRTIKIDSVHTFTDSTLYYPFHTPRFHIEGHTTKYDSVHSGCWLGQKVKQLNDGTFIFDDIWDNNLMIKTQANIGDSWTFYRDTSNTWYSAKVVSTDTLTVFSSLDSIKKIAITAYTASGIDSTNPLRNFTITLSKNHGFCKVFDLYTFPYHRPDTTYYFGFDFFMDRVSLDYQHINEHSGSFPTSSNAEFKLVTFIIPNDTQMYHWDSGDYFDCTLSEYVFLPKPSHTTVIEKSISGTSISYYLIGTHLKANGGISTPIVSPVIDDSGRYSYRSFRYSVIPIGIITEGILGVGLNKFVFYFPDDTTYCSNAPAYITVAYDFPIPYYLEIIKYKTGIGRVHADIYGSDYGAYVGDLIYYYHNGSRCGVAGSNNVTNIWYPTNEVIIYPNPASTSITVDIKLHAPYSISMQNIIGQTFINQISSKETETIDISNIPDGMYMLVLCDGEGQRVTRKVVIVH